MREHTKDYIQHHLKTDSCESNEEHPELQAFAIRVTCSSFGCERNWSVFEMVNFILKCLF